MITVFTIHIVIATSCIVDMDSRLGGGMFEYSTKEENKNLIKMRV